MAHGLIGGPLSRAARAGQYVPPSGVIRGMSWHHFTPSSGDDHECARCGVEVSDDALPFVAVDCPLPACSDPGNPGPCVLVLTEESVRCAYCDRNGTLEDEPDDDSEADDGPV